MAQGARRRAQGNLKISNSKLQVFYIPCAMRLLPAIAQKAKEVRLAPVYQKMCIVDSMEFR
jgi:hypothetical protein